jgi:predicted KAP-like P-loop ATPase
MDDIDRLDKDEIQAVFKLVKLSADFPNTSYILAFDEEMVAHALQEKYGSFEAGRNYIEKIVQVPLHLPPAHEYALRSITFEGVEAALQLAGIEPSEGQGQRFVNTFVLAFQSHLKTPRLAKRYVNALTFALPLLKDEVDPVDLMIIEAIRVFIPRLYYAIRNHGDVFLGKHLDQNRKNGTEQAKAVIEDAIKDLAETDKLTARHVIKELFPRMGGIDLLGGAIHGAEWQSTWSRQKRIAAIDYFDRYFSYGVPPNDFSDRKVEEFLKQIESEDVEFVVQEIRALATRERVGVFISKLRAREDKVSPAVASRLAQGVALCGEVFPNTGGVLGDFGASTAAQACILIRNLIKRLPSETERDALALLGLI